MIVSMPRHGSCTAWLFVVLAVLVLGCGKGSSGRLSVDGTISGPGEEKFDGAITFLPEKGQSGVAATAAVVKGEYRFDKDNGPKAGKFRVVISRPVVKFRSPKAAGRNGGPATKSEWERTANVPADGPYRFDFTLD